MPDGVKFLQQHCHNQLHAICDLQHYQAYGRFDVVACVEDAKLKAVDHEVERGQPGLPHGGKLLQSH